MIVSMTYRDPCAFCRCRLRGVYVANVRVNKNSLRTADRGGLRATGRRCPECNQPVMQAVSERWALDAESQREVDATRARRGWTK